MVERADRLEMWEAAVSEGVSPVFLGGGEEGETCAGVVRWVTSSMGGR